MTLQNSIDTLRTKMSGVDNLNSVLKFDCGADGVVVIDGKAQPHVVSQGDRVDADVTITLSIENFEGIVTGKVNPGIAFVMGKIKVKGDKAPLLKLQKIL